MKFQNIYYIQFVEYGGTSGGPTTLNFYRACQITKLGR